MLYTLEKYRMYIQNIFFNHNVNKEMSLVFHNESTCKTHWYLVTLVSQFVLFPT